MPTLLETASKLNEMLDTGWAGLTPIAVENLQYEEQEGQPYLETHFIPFPTQNVNLAAATQKRKRTEGLLFVKIRVPKGKGIGLAYDYANKIQDIMDNKNPLPNLLTNTSNVQRIGDTIDGWFVVTCDVPFISDEI